MRIPWLVVTFLLVGGALAVRLSADEGADRRAALRLAEEPLRDRRWADAAAGLRALRQKWPQSDEATEAWVLEARALLQAGQAREALDATSAFLAARGQDLWAGRVRHVAAEAYAALGDPAKASEALQALAEDVAAPEARARIGALHLRLADEDFDGVDAKDDLGRNVKKRDVARALASYRRALAVGLAPADALKARERIARALEESNDAAGARAAWAALSKELDTEKAPAAPEAAERWLVGQGRAALLAGQPDEARPLLQRALARFPKGALALETLRLLGQERLTPRDGQVDDLAFEEGVALLRRAVLEHRDEPGSVDAQILLAEAYRARGQAEKSAQEWSALVDRKPQDVNAPVWRDQAGLALAQAGRFDDAVAEWNRFLAAYANHPLWPQVRERIAAAGLAKAQMLEERGDRAGAVAAWKRFAEERPDDPRAPESLGRAAQALRAGKDPEGALTLWRAIAGRYASTPWAAQARLEIALLLEEDVRRLEEAVQAYDEVVAKHAGSPQAQQAAERLQRLKNKHLELRMERVQGSAETPVLRVVTRNVEGLRVRVYRLGLEEYFTRKGALEGVEGLQLEVVKPDLTSEWKFEGYKPFLLLEADRPLPVKGPGAFVVVAGDDDLTSTVLFLVSDVEIVVKKAGARDLFVWAFERQGHAPVAGARVLVSDGGKVSEVGTTGADGTWHGEHEGSRDRVLVLAERGAAGSELGAAPVVASGFATKAWVATDRPVYRPGQEVAWRAVYLRAADGAYAAPETTAGRLTVLDARGQVLSEQDVAGGDFGTFAGTVPIDAEATLGTWTLRFAVPGQGSWDGTFEVLEYRKPEFTVEVTPRQPSVRTGQKVEATLALRYAFGGPVPGARVEWTAVRRPRRFEAPTPDDVSWYLQDAPGSADRAPGAGSGGTLMARGEGRTGADGTLAIAFESGAADEDAEIVIGAQAEDVTRRWVTGSGRVAVTRRDHLASIRVERQVVKPKEPLSVEVRTMDAALAPVARSGAVVLLRVRRTAAAPPAPPGIPVPASPVPVDGKRGVRPLVEEEVEVATYPVATDVRGRAEVRLECPEPGRWRLRWRALDARGGLVTASTDVEALGEAQDLSKEARLVASRLLHVEGEEAEVLLSAPVGQATALVTYEAEKVLEHRFVRLTGASTLLRLPVTGAHAPNVTLAVAIPGKDGLLTAETGIVVLRRLTFDVRFAKETASPGEELEATITAKDAAGRPVRAEAGFSLLDAALYEIAPDKTPPILPYFYGQRRGHAVTTSSSIGWRTYGATHATSADLLAEAASHGEGAAEELARGALRLAQEALRRGDWDLAVAQALQAQNADPGSWDARALIADLKARPEAQAVLRALQARLEAADANLASATRMAEGAPAPGALPAPAPATPALDSWAAKDAPAEKDKDAGGNACGAGGKACGAADEERADTLGAGGGAGGGVASKARGGRMDRKKQGGGAAGRPVVRSAESAFQKADELVGYTADFDAQVAGAELPALRSDLRDSAAWFPRVLTGADGKATVKVKLPENLTTWRAVVNGVSKDALVGEGRGTLVTRKDLLVRVDAPRFLVQTDQATFPVAVHNGTDRGLDVAVGMQAEGLDLSGEAGTVRVDAAAGAVVDRKLGAPAFGAARVEVTATSEAGGDRTEARLPVLARGVRFVDGRSGLIGTERGDTEETFVEIPGDAVPGSARLTLVLQPGIDAALLDALLTLESFPYGCVEQSVHRFLPALDARAALQAIGSPMAARLARLDEAVRRGAARLVSLQSADGSFGWWRGGQGSLVMTAYALLGLVGARDSGVPDLTAPVARAAQALARLLAQGDEDGRALAHWALARAGALVPDAYASTFRRRSDDLSVAGLAWLTLAAQAAKRSFDVEECARLLIARRVEDGATTLWKAKPQDCFLGSDREATALAVRALIEAGAATPHAERGLAWLLAHRSEGMPGTTKEAAAFVGAAAAFVRTARVQGFGGTVEVLLDATRVHTLKTGAGAPAAAALRVALPGAGALAPGRHKVAFRLEGEGRLAWALRLEGVRASDDLPAEEHGLLVERRYLVPEKALLAGESAPTKPGYDILRPAARPKVEPKDVDRAGSGEPVLVRLTLTAPRDLEYVVVEDPLPAGFEVVSDSTRGPFDWQERRDARQVFFCSRVPKGVLTLEYVLQATHLGRFTALGTLATAMYAPEVHGRAAGRVLSVVPRDAAPGADVEVPPTPDEQYARAKELLAQKQDDEARRALTALKAEQPLSDEVLEEIEGLLLRLAIDHQDAREVVRAREELLRRNPRWLPGDFESARTIAAAYRTVGEHESAGTQFRDLVARGFALEVDWMQTLAARGREIDGLDALERALRRGPASNAAASAAFRAAQRWRELRRPEGRGGRPAGKPMDEETLDALWSLTAHFAHHVAADPAGYALVEALRRTKDLSAAGGAAEAFLRRFPKSAFADDTRYFLAETRFKAFEEAPGAATGEAVRQAALPLTVEGQFPNPDGSVAPLSEFRERAFHLLARVAHVLGNLGEAEGLYAQASSVEDAREALAWLRAKSLALDDTVVRVGEGPALLPVRYRNLDKVTLRSYPVDLQVLFAVRKTLVGLNAIDLSGIAPQRQWDVALPPVPGRAAGELAVDAGVPASAYGAWLVVAKGGDLEAGTLVVKTSLAAALQRVDAKVRVYVRDAAGNPVRGATVAVSDGASIRARGLTDARGVFEAPGVGATAFAVVSKGDQVALAR